MAPYYDVMSNLMAYENDDLNEEQIDTLFQYLIDTGMAWTLQGSYGRMADMLIKLGRVHVHGGNTK